MTDTLHQINGHAHAPGPDPVPERPLSEYTVPYLAERVHLLEGYVATMLQMVLNHHPYLGPHAQGISDSFQKRHAEIEARYPVSRIAMPPSGIITPN